MTFTKSLNLGLLTACFCAVLMTPQTGHSTVVKCIKFDASEECTGDSPISGRVDMAADCSGNHIGVIAVCSSKDGGSPGALSNNLPRSDVPDSNKYCWCKMVMPAVSKWVYTVMIQSDDTCSYNCIGACGYFLGPVYGSDGATFRSGMFSSLGE